MTSENVCIYHKNCIDGMASAWVVNKFFEGDVTLIAAEYHKRNELVLVKETNKENPDAAQEFFVSDELIDKNVFIVDFSFSREETILLQKVTKKLVVIDHHSTSEKHLKGLFEVDQTKCGAILTWNYFFGSNEPPEAFKLIQDNDLGKWEDENTLPWIMALQSCKLTLEHFDLFIQMPIEEGVKRGLPIYTYHMKNVNSLKRNARNFNLDEFKGKIVNANSHYRNELGRALAEEADFSVIYWETDTNRVFSLRGKDKKIDLSALAERFGGGGHENAAAFSIPLGDPRIPTAHYILRSIRTNKED